MPRVVMAIVVLGLAWPAWGQSFLERLNEGYEALRLGDTETALAVFHDLETDEPDSPLVNYSIGSGLYAEALADGEGEDLEGATNRLIEARIRFEVLFYSDDAFVRENALYNAANCTALVAKHSVALGKHEDTLEAFEKSVTSYLEVLRRYPDHEGAQRNLEHMRFLLKSMLQNPPPEQQQSGDGDSEDKEGEGDEEKSRGDGSEQENAEDGEEQDADADAEDGSEGADSQDSSDLSARETEEEGEPLDRQNIEAILQSLEDQDREEQKNLRRSKAAPQVRNGRWW